MSIYFFFTDKPYSVNAVVMLIAFMVSHAKVINLYVDVRLVTLEFLVLILALVLSLVHKVANISILAYTHYLTD